LTLMCFNTHATIIASVLLQVNYRCIQSLHWYGLDT